MTTSSSYPNTDLMHEVHCRKCPTVFHCVCGNMAFHAIDRDLNLCGICKSAKHDPAYEPNDQADQGGGVGGESTFPAYQSRFLRR